MRTTLLAMIVVALAVGCARSTTSTPAGALGGECLPDRRCSLGLECFRGICLEPEMIAGRDGGAPLGRDASVPLDPDRGDGGRRADDAGVPPVTGEVVARGSGELLAVFVIEAGWIVVDRDAARLIGRDGGELATFASGREITAAAFDGEYVAIADRAELTSLTPDLATIATSRLPRFCEAGVIVSGHRFVCGPENDWDRVFSTHDLETGATLGLSTEHTYNGIPMERVPGTDHFVTTTVSSSPSDFHLYEVTASGVATFVNESPYHGDIAASTVFAFVGSPATHLVNHVGVMLRIFGDGCAPGSSFTSGCFVRDGDLGTLSGSEGYVAMTEDGTSIYALQGDGDRFFSDPLCETACTIERVDPAARRVTSSRGYAVPFLAIPAFEHDRWASKVVLGVQSEGDRFDGFTAYEVRLAPYE
ncbi:Hypothetical protein I5071_16770 [Sandaracinus amylolyticus]|nr:Hypothetical protein I5071_16770 [Sandaracinus amylolyticus]